MVILTTEAGFGGSEKKHYQIISHFSTDKSKDIRYKWNIKFNNIYRYVCNNVFSEKKPVILLYRF
jgi:hypothetical protein